MRPVFIHINKTAGTSVVASAASSIIDAGHRTAASWVAEHGRGASLFSVIRHPYDRMLSEYNYRRRRWAAGENNPHLANLELPVDDWVIATLDGGEYRTRAFFERTGVPFNAGNMVGDSLIWFIPQVSWLGDGGGALLVDDIVRFERLDDDWSALCARYGLKNRLVHVNASPRQPGVSDRLAARTRDVIYEHQRGDFDVFGYER